MTEGKHLLEDLRPVAFAIAFGMLGGVSDAEDVVQEALSRTRQALDAVGTEAARQPPSGGPSLQCSGGTRMTWLQPVHVVGALVWLACTVALAVAPLVVKLSGRDLRMPRFTRTLLSVSRGLIAPAAVLVLGSGIWLVLADSAWSFSQLWVVLGLILFAAVLAGAIALTRLVTRIGQAADNRGTAKLQRLWLVGQVGLVVALVGALVDMGLKPGS